MLLPSNRRSAMVLVRTAHEYRHQLRSLLADCRASLSEEEQRVLRAVVRERRNWRRDREQTSAPAAINQRAEQIVQLLESAARVLRPRETQELDDLVAGKKPAERQVVVPGTPVRVRRRGGG
jgi:hypothetical protein